MHKTSNRVLLGRRLRELVEHRSAPMAGLAQALDTDERRIRRLCDGVASLSASDGYRLAVFLGVSVNDFVGNEPPTLSPRLDHSEEAMRLNAALRKLNNRPVQRPLIDLIDTLAGGKHAG